MPQKFIAPRDSLEIGSLVGQLNLPYYPDSIALVRGLLLQMTRASSWEEIAGETLTPEQAAEVGQAIYDSFRLKHPMYAIFAEQRAYNVDGGTNQAATWNLRQLNTTVYQDELLTEVTPDLANYRVALEAGKYRLIGRAAACYVARTMVRLRLTADGVSTIYAYGQSHWDATNNGQSAVVWSEVDIVLDLAGTKMVYLDHYTQVAATTYGLGVATSVSGVNNTYAELVIESL